MSKTDILGIVIGTGCALAINKYFEERARKRAFREQMEQSLEQARRHNQVTYAKLTKERDERLKRMAENHKRFESEMDESLQNIHIKNVNSREIQEEIDRMLNDMFKL